MRFSKRKLLAACIPILPAFAAVLPSEGSLKKVARVPREQNQLLDFGSSYSVLLFAISRQLLTVQRITKRLRGSDL